MLRFGWKKVGEVRKKVQTGQKIVRGNKERERERDRQTDRKTERERERESKKK